MSSMTTNERLQETLSLALEDRSPGYQDLVSNANVIFQTMKERGQWKPFEGPTIREPLLYNETGSYTRYSGYQFLNPVAAELINSAEFTPKLSAISVMLSGEEILKNSGGAQILDVMEVHMEAAENEMIDRFTEDMHSAGTSDNQIGGLLLAIPTDPTAGTYGGISRVNNSQWRTTTYDANSFYAGETAVTSTSIKKMLDRIIIARSRGKKGPDLLVSSTEHWEAFSQATVAIQRIQGENSKGKLGFQSLEYYGGGRRIELVCEGGVGSAMPSNTTYGIDISSLTMRYHKDRNFSKIGGKQMPVNQDAIVQHIGFFGELTMKNPLHNFKLYDSSP